jgi:hypothetical protein
LRCAHDPSLRLKNGSAQDDAVNTKTLYTHLHSLRIRTPVMAWAIPLASARVA